MYLLDTNVVSELRRPRPHPAVVAWFQLVPRRDLSIAAVTLTEIRIGIERTRRADPAKADEIEAWLGRLRARHQVVPMDGRIADLWGRMQESRLNGVDARDLLIAATAVADGLITVPRNRRDFLRINGCFPLPGLIDPFRFDGRGGEVVVVHRGG